MSESEFLEKTIEGYSKLGYHVVTAPTADQLPPALSTAGADLIATNHKEQVAVQIKRRNEGYDLEEVRRLADRVEATPGWRLHVVAMPATWEVDVPRDGTDLDPEKIQQFAEKAESELNLGALDSALLWAWAAVAASMLRAAHASGLLSEREPPSFVLKTLYSNGLIAREDYDAAQKSYRVRNALVHGVESPAFTAADVRFLLDFAGRLQNSETVGSA
jgi:hypothetical protein